MSFLDVIGVLAIFFTIFVFCIPAKVKIVNGYIHFKVWPFFSRTPKHISELVYFHAKIGAIPVCFKFKDGTVFRWTAFPISQHGILKKEVERCIRQYKDGGNQ
ncbi:hypothetical protein [Thiomicrorhabdus sp. Kp2]|uniref:hypothetical protein n=1 Tax=Thiomicrorhabdus sp. Kp2 TaxID=1123518 RepID=UPI000594465A|nr:hypothetical protein [Thiomicrorhabdus sp. Kp2]